MGTIPLINVRCELARENADNKRVLELLFLQAERLDAFTNTIAEFVENKIPKEVFLEKLETLKQE